MSEKTIFPDWILESSWEVCNKVGGIYAVLSTRAKTLQERFPDHVIFIGPDVWGDKPCPYFTEEKAVSDGTLRYRVGRWEVPGRPKAILVDFSQYYARKNEIYAHLWEDYQVDSLHAYGDYDEASMFSYAAGLVVESFVKAHVKPTEKVVYHGNEWMTGLGVLYVKKHVPQVATVFTTHATSIGRSIAGNGKPLYEYLWAYNGDQMASELNMQSKHSIEKQTAHNVDCFTTVSDITARECKELLDKEPDVVLPNGFEDNFVPRGASFTRKRNAARRRLLAIAGGLLGQTFDDDTLIVSTSGRYEFRNKGIDVFIEAMNRLRLEGEALGRQVVAFVEVPGWVSGPRADLQERLASKSAGGQAPLDQPWQTHWLHNQDQDQVLGMMRSLGMANSPADRVKVIFMPCYLTGDDGIVNLTYYDTLLGHDLCVYPSYYEPWGYTPLEAIAFHVPCITSDLAGFGLWVNKELGHYGALADGVKVVHRTDSNFSETADAVKDAILEFSNLTKKEVDHIRGNAAALSKKALWSNFIKYYYQAYDIALRKTIKH